MHRPTVDKLYTHAAIRLAANGLYRVTRNNPRVGCLLVKNGTVIGRGAHLHDGGAHAEVQALATASEDPSGATAYVSLEPCCIEGRTPPCTAALISAGIHRVVVGELDPNPEVNGSGVRELQEASISVTVLGLVEARSLNPGFHKRMTHARPYVRVKSGMSLDGRVAMESGESQWITSSDARQDVQRLRARSGAIVTGKNTILSDNPKLTVRDTRYGSCSPMRVVLDTQGQTPSDAELFKHPGEVVLVCNSTATTPPNSIKWEHDNAQADLDSVHERLAKVGVNEVLVEAGPTLTSSYLQTGLWDEFVFYVAPKILGSRARPVAQLQIDALCNAINGKLHSIDTIGEDLRIVIINAESCV
ncbi:MAG: bifunctional diaminohydroxyphosphoribosylaminopyrimidine deaminase/5-amino-6-(5-phosphoribosylamino)uracil reductase RibD [Gammaproteobacteria bacterium]|nr:bifunctional diaminohydroxyphosphoribosylaminopyrimidine deaminase/5-amino-6-(5-phosphoribosylamino)uracil reductase RibD [Gammaproteobacteria bacterium]MYF01817.1 bifunctional diaminohydroxyphosphoribosylaminopyrimidine deaminase/5-amino-6-(5-phosphoribosylamino)uracil reductase RibD [Gammaproteobacteria bacterium]MYI77895.1 bifunctional diaminohydroxyphosphoribosylaminopyrimidine deaminase/5-amino-6-(5-phosphoribosylamino)uracil reductase RibD [Gammaproteobacteria bacterium]